jgi:hypothetical protein
MGNDPNAVLTTKFKASGGAYVAPFDASLVLPTNASSPLPAALKPLGYIGPDGLKRTADAEVHEVLAAGGVKVKAVNKSDSLTYELTLMQSDLAVLAEVYGPENVTITNGVLRVRHNGKNMPIRTWVFELADGVNSLREVVARAQVTSKPEVVYGTGEETVYAVTLTALDDAEGDKANTYQEFGDGPDAPEQPPVTGGKVQATASPIFNGGGVTGINITGAGSGYTSDPVVTIMGTGSGATAEAHVIDGEVVNITVLTPGTGYTAGAVEIAAP